MKKASKQPADSLSAALAESFKIALDSPVAQQPGDAAQRGPANLGRFSAEPTTEEESARPKGVVKTTVSFYSVEQDQVDAILGLLLKSRRHRGGFSDAVKIALRLCPLEESRIGKAWDAARALDQRTKRAKKK
jgi:hypothetical protein